MSMHHLTASGISPQQFGISQPSLIGYQSFAQGDFPQPNVGYGIPSTQLPMAGWGERQHIPSDHLHVAYAGRGMSQEELQMASQMRQAMPQNVPVQQQPTPPGQSNPMHARNSPLPQLVSPHANTSAQPTSHPPVASSPFSVDFLLRETPSTVEAEDMTQGYARHSQEIHHDNVPQGYEERAEGIGGFPPQEIPPGYSQPGDTVGPFTQQEPTPQYTETESTPQFPQPEAGGLAPYQLHSDYAQPMSSPPEDINLPSEKPFSPPELILTEREDEDVQDENESHDQLDQSDPSNAVMQNDVTADNMSSEPSPRIAEEQKSPSKEESENELTVDIEAPLHGYQEPSGYDPREPINSAVNQSNDSSAQQADRSSSTGSKVIPTSPYSPEKQNNTAPSSESPEKLATPTPREVPQPPPLVRHRRDLEFDTDDDDVFLPAEPVPDKPDKMEEGGEPPSLKIEGGGEPYLAKTEAGGEPSSLKMEEGGESSLLKIDAGGEPSSLKGSQGKYELEFTSCCVNPMTLNCLQLSKVKLHK